MFVVSPDGEVTGVEPDVAANWTDVQYYGLLLNYGARHVVPRARLSSQWPHPWYAR